MDFAAHYDVASQCPACRQDLRHLSTNDGPSALTAGGFAVCNRCGHLFWMDVFHGEIRNLNREEKAKLAEALRTGNPVAAQIRACQKGIASRICPND